MRLINREDPDIIKLLEERGLIEEDIQLSVEGGLSEQRFYYDRTNRDLIVIRKRFEYLSIYVKLHLDRDTDSAEILSAYSHKAGFASDQPGFIETRNLSGTEKESNWICGRCEVPVLKVKDIVPCYEEYEFPAVRGLRCQTCSFEMFDETMVVVEFTAAEEMMEGK